MKVKISFSRSVRRAVLSLLLVGAAGLIPVRAGSVNLLWNGSSGATGYKLYSGSSSGSYGTPQTLGSATQTTVSNMTDCAATFFAVSAFNAAGESNRSSEVSTWPRPSLTSANPSQVQPGQQLSIVLSGNNFQPGLAIQFANSAITVNSVTRDACGQVTATITVGSSAASGTVQISAVNPNGVTGVGTNLLTVASAPLPDVQNLRRTDR